MSLLVVGSVAIDSVRTPYGRTDEELGGSAVYFSFAAACFCTVRLVGIVGDDFPPPYLDRISARPVDTRGLRRVAGRTFRWRGAYEGRMNQAETLEVQLNVFCGFDPQIPAEYADSEYVFLANGSPATHMSVLEQLDGPRFVMADTMNFYIENERDALLELLPRLDALVINDAEARQLSGESNLPSAARRLCGMGPAWCIIKKGEHGALMLGPQGLYALPALPVEQVVDPTGAGDSFAGGLMGFLAGREQGGDITPEAMKTAVAYGAVAASFAIERFGPWALEGLSRHDLRERFARYVRSTQLRAP